MLLDSMKDKKNVWLPYYNNSISSTPMWTKTIESSVPSATIPNAILRQTKEENKDATYMYKIKEHDKYPPVDIDLYNPGGHVGSFRIAISQEKLLNDAQILDASLLTYKNVRIKERCSYIYQNRWRLDLTKVQEGTSIKLAETNPMKYEVEIELIDINYLNVIKSNKEVIYKLLYKLTSLLPANKYEFKLPSPIVYFSVVYPFFDSRSGNLELKVKDHQRHQHVTVTTTPVTPRIKQLMQLCSNSTHTVIECTYSSEKGCFIVIGICETYPDKKHNTLSQVMQLLEKQIAVANFEKKK